MAAGAVVRCLLRSFGIEVFGFVRGALDAITDVAPDEDNWHELRAARDASDVYIPDEGTSERLREAIRQAKYDKDTVGGFVEARGPDRAGILHALGPEARLEDRGGDGHPGVQGTRSGSPGGAR